eukprot:844769-Alexandrium_andersonii.AAC.1
MDLVTQHAGHVLALQEHSCPQHGQAAAQARLAQAGFTSVFSGVDPDAARPAGGVVIAVRAPVPMQAVQPRSEEFAAFQKLGRCIAAIVGFSRSTPVLMVSAYGWQGGERDQEAAAKTSA